MARYAQLSRRFVESLEGRLLMAAPGNDNFADRILLSGNPVATTGTNVEATAEANEPAHAGSPAQRSVWWSWTAPSTGVIRISTAGSNFDTVVAVYTGSALNMLSLVAADDDGGIAAGYSVATFTANAGTTYQIAVDGFQGAQGNIALGITSASAVAINGTDGNDTITVGTDGVNYSVTVNGTTTNYLIASVLSLTINGGAGDDDISVDSLVGPVTLVGGIGNDTLTGGNSSDLLRGEDGDDVINARDGNDIIFGNQGNDSIDGGVGNDTIMAAVGNDTVEGGIGDDSILGGDGLDTIVAGDGNDYVEGRGKADSIVGGAGNDTIWAGAGNDTVNGEAGDDWIDIGFASFSDSVDGGDGTDTVQRTRGDNNDTILNVETFIDV